MRCCHCKHCEQIDFDEWYCPLVSCHCDAYTSCNRFVFKTLFWFIADTVKLISTKIIYKEWLR